MLSAVSQVRELPLHTCIHCHCTTLHICSYPYHIYVWLCVYAGKNGKTKFTIENATRTRIVLADTKIHLLGSFQNTRIARDAICNLIMGSPPGKVYSKLRSVCARMNESY